MDKLPSRLVLLFVLMRFIQGLAPKAAANTDLLKITNFTNEEGRNVMIEEYVCL